MSKKGETENTPCKKLKQKTHLVKKVGNFTYICSLRYFIPTIKVVEYILNIKCKKYYTGKLVKLQKLIG